MRITNSMLVKNMMTNLSGSMSRLNTYQSQLSSGKKITKISDDPVGVIKSLQSRRNLSVATQYRENAEDAQSVMDFTETALMDINDLITRAYELTVGASNGTNTTTEKEAIAMEVDQIRSQLINTLNSTHGSRFIFGGYNVQEKPFIDNDGAVLYNNIDIKDGNMELLDSLDSESVSYPIGNDAVIDVTMSGLKVIGKGNDNLLNVFSDLSVALKNNGNVDGYVSSLQDKKEHILSLLAEIGGKTNRLESVISRFDTDIINYKDIKSRIEDIDQAEVIMSFKMEETVYRSALSVGARVIQPSLVDFLS